MLIKEIKKIHGASTLTQNQSHESSPVSSRWVKVSFVEFKLDIPICFFYEKKQIITYIINMLKYNLFDIIR